MPALLDAAIKGTVLLALAGLAVAVLRKRSAAVRQLVWGAWRTKLLLPAEARNWPADRRWVVLHELAHVKRHDCQAKLIARLAWAVYWFNPLCWMAFKRVQREAETACDDLI